MKIPIKINGREYFYENRYGGEFEEYLCTQFYEKGEPIQKRVIKKKFLFFGPIVSDVIVNEDNFIPRFTTPLRIAEHSFFDIEQIKKTEEKYNLWKNISMGNLEI